MKIEIQKRTVYFWVGMIILLGGIFGVYAWANPTTGVGHSYNEIQPCSNGQILQTSGGSWTCVDMPSGGGNSLWSESNGDISYTGGDVYVGGSSDEAYLDGGATIENGLLVKSGGVQITEGNVEISNDLSVGGTIYGWAVPSDIKITSASHSGEFHPYDGGGNGYQSMYNWIQDNSCLGYHVCNAMEITNYLQTHAELPVQFDRAWYNTGTFASHGEGTADCEGWRDVDADDFGNVWRNTDNRDHPGEAGCLGSDPHYPVLCCKY